MSDDENSVAPKDRVNIRYHSRAEDGEDVEIPFKPVVVGDFSFREDATAVGDRQLIDVNKDNFDEVMKAKNITLDLTVKDEMSGAGGDAKLQAKLHIRTPKDLTPDGIVAQVPEMQRQLELARTLQDVKADLANPTKLAALRERIDAVLKDEEIRKKLEAMKNLKAGQP